MVERGAISEAEAAKSLKAAQNASEAELRKRRLWLGRNKFGGDTIGDVKRYLREHPGKAAQSDPWANRGSGRGESIYNPDAGSDSIYGGSQDVWAGRGSGG